jgi:hypothetical protein
MNYQLPLRVNATSVSYQLRQPVQRQTVHPVVAPTESRCAYFNQEVNVYIWLALLTSVERAENPHFENITILSTSCLSRLHGNSLTTMFLQKFIHYNALNFSLQARKQHTERPSR